jgi:hypothetical protein
MITVDVRDLKRLTRELQIAKASSLPYAVRNSLNRSAFATRRAWQQQIEAEFVNRNRYTTRSVLVTKATGSKLSGLKAVVGSTAPYMGVQESGGTVRGGKHKAIPTSYAAGQMGAIPRSKVVRRPNRMGALQAKKGRGMSKRQRNAVAIARARKSGSKVAVLETSRGKALVRVLGRPKKGTRSHGGGTGKSQIRMVWDLSRGSVRVPPTPTLQHTLRRMQGPMLQIHKDAIIEQLRRHRVLGF